VGLAAYTKQYRGVFLRILTPTTPLRITPSPSVPPGPPVPLLQVLAPQPARAGPPEAREEQEAAREQRKTKKPEIAKVLPVMVAQGAQAPLTTGPELRDLIRAVAVAVPAVVLKIARQGPLVAELPRAETAVRVGIREPDLTDLPGKPELHLAEAAVEVVAAVATTTPSVEPAASVGRA